MTTAVYKDERARQDSHRVVALAILLAGIAASLTLVLPETLVDERLPWPLFVLAFALAELAPVHMELRDQT